MCPGGVVVAAASEKNSIVTNGMSEYNRAKENANSAFVVSVGPADFNSVHPLAGIEFQQVWEKKAFEIGGSSNAAPVQRLEDFIGNRASKTYGKVKPSYTGETKLKYLNLCLPLEVSENLKQSIPCFDRKLRQLRNEGCNADRYRDKNILAGTNYQKLTLGMAEGFIGIYPTGEGAGYAGGIVSSAVDGLKIAEKIIECYAPLTRTLIP